MKSGIAILNALGLAVASIMACGGVAAAGEPGQAVVVKVADDAVPVPAPRLRRPPHYPHYVVSPPYPAACGTVLFPRSPLCAGHPASYGFYATFPWNHYWSY